ncbi:MAG TPA: hypothetical protein VFG10_04370 [Saprospiraceae bacterium]|nr:hypothetical protein [Saprospiraceae bacterium]
MKKVSKRTSPLKKVVHDKALSVAWVYKKGIATLMDGKVELISIDLHKKSKSAIHLGKSIFEISNKGYWNPKTIIERKNKKIAFLNRNIWDNIATLHFPDESYFEFHVYHHPTLILIISLKDGTEICSFQLLSAKPKLIKFTTKEVYTKSEKHLLILGLGQFVFQGIVKEYHIGHETRDAAKNNENKEGQVLRKIVRAKA